MDLSQAKNPFLPPSPLSLFRLNQLCFIAANAQKRGWCVGSSGNFSILDSNEIQWMSPSGVEKGSLNPLDFIAIDLKSAKVLSALPVKPSDETDLHSGIYQTDSSARVIIHLHLPHAVARSQRVDALEFTGCEMQKAFGEKTHDHTLRIPTIENTQNMSALGARLAKILTPKSNMLMLRGHGVYAWGDDAQRVYHRLEALEFLCKTTEVRP